MPRRLELAAEEPERLLKSNYLSIDEFLCSALRGEAPRWADLDPAVTVAKFLQCSAHHGVQALLYHAACGQAGWAEWPADVRAALESASKAGVAQDLLRRHHLGRLLAEFEKRGIPSLLTKGEALAATLYAQPGTRARCDSDVFIDIGSIRRARQAALDLGFEIAGPVYKGHQFTVTRPGDEDGHVRFDVHWRILNAPRFARKLSFDAAMLQSVEVPGMAPARAIGDTDALLLACMHRFGSDRHDRNRLIWIYDIHALLTGMTSASLMAFAQRAVNLSVQDVCLEGFVRSQECFHTHVSQDVLDVLAAAGPESTPRTRLAESNLGLLLHDWKELPGWQCRIELLGELFFPPSEALTRKYGECNRLWIPLLYLRHWGEGLACRFTLR